MNIILISILHFKIIYNFETTLFIKIKPLKYNNGIILKQRCDLAEFITM
jgi:hypothetical protein